MDITATSVLAYQLAQNQQNIGMAMMKQTIKQDQAIANTILESAVQAATAADGSRGSQLDITV